MLTQSRVDEICGQIYAVHIDSGGWGRGNVRDAEGA